MHRWWILIVPCGLVELSLCGSYIYYYFYLRLG